MSKFIAVVKHEYRKIVMKWTFLIGTFLLPLIMAAFALVPAIIFSLPSEPTRLAIVDPSGKIAPRLRNALSPEAIAERSKKAAKDAGFDINTSPSKGLNDSSIAASQTFIFVDYDAQGKTDDAVRGDLMQQVASKQLDAFLIVPNDLTGTFYFRSRKGGDFIAGDLLADALNSAVRSERLAEANISEAKLAEINRAVTLDQRSVDEHGGEKDSDLLLAASFVIGIMIYLTLAIYGQVIMGAVVEEKETRIAEILFSSARPFELMMGKIVGVGLAGLTQLAIWLISLAALIAFAAIQADLAPLLQGLPHITAPMVLLFLAYFLAGYFAYAAIFAFIGSIVTTVQEGGQFAFPAMMLMLAGFYFSFAVIRDPNSPLSVVTSILPFFAPMTMPVRIMAEMPPAWQIVLSLIVNIFGIIILVWLASRVYRIGMLMYGKRATIPEIWKWMLRA